MLWLPHGGAFAELEQEHGATHLQTQRLAGAQTLVLDFYSRDLLVWHRSRSGRSTTAESALEKALIARYSYLGKVRHPFLLRSDNGLVFTGLSYTALVKSEGGHQDSRWA